MALVAFTLILWTEAGARRLATELEQLGFRTEVESYSVDGEWTCVAVRQMQVTLTALRELRRHFEGLVRVEGGAYDGWELGYEPWDSAA